jgi:NhaP-type Na+/H+ or K+/H+ antiporter
MDTNTWILWYLIAGGVLILMALVSSLVQRLPLTTAMLYLGLGVALGPVGGSLLVVDPLRHAALVEHVTEVALLISLFTAGLKLRLPFSDPQWRLALRLACGSMILTIGSLTWVGVYGLGLPLGAAVLLGAILAPTDPVLASEVQVAHAWDQDRVRFSLTGEAGLNDGTAFPFVLLGLGLLGLHDLGPQGWRWILVDVGWAVSGGLSIGALLGTTVGALVLYLRQKHKEALGLDDFLALGLIALAYGSALLLHSSGFLAVFAAGVALRRIERKASGERSAAAVAAVVRESEAAEVATDPTHAPAYMAHAVLVFNEHLERLGEVVVVLLLGAMLTMVAMPPAALWFIPLLLLLIRPLAVGIGLMGSPTAYLHRALLGWFGIRGIGSLYYLAYALQHGLAPAVSQPVIALTLSTVAVSVIVHGLSVTPLMTRYGEWMAQRMRRHRMARQGLRPGEN